MKASLTWEGLKMNPFKKCSHVLLEHIMLCSVSGLMLHLGCHSTEGKTFVLSAGLWREGTQSNGWYPPLKNMEGRPSNNGRCQTLAVIANHVPLLIPPYLGLSGLCTVQEKMRFDRHAGSSVTIPHKSTNDS
ncbi:hypothetical protein FKM82_009288 [Ascaphus truei]